MIFDKLVIHRIWKHNEDDTKVDFAEFYNYIIKSDNYNVEKYSYIRQLSIYCYDKGGTNCKYHFIIKNTDLTEEEFEQYLKIYKRNYVIDKIIDI